MTAIPFGDRSVAIDAVAMDALVTGGGDIPARPTVVAMIDVHTRAILGWTVLVAEDPAPAD